MVFIKLGFRSAKKIQIVTSQRINPLALGCEIYDVFVENPISDLLKLWRGVDMVVNFQ